jgi:hypothetical protein
MNNNTNDIRDNKGQTKPDLKQGHTARKDQPGREQRGNENRASGQGAGQRSGPQPTGQDKPSTPASGTERIVTEAKGPGETKVTAKDIRGGGA